tara:strand:+ start:5809 stop:5991 length:183 start_codon:yes stop_codon:yes gene_type:complete
MKFQTIITITRCKKRFLNTSETRIPGLATFGGVGVLNFMRAMLSVYYLMMQFGVRAGMIK